MSLWVSWLSYQHESEETRVALCACVSFLEPSILCLGGPWAFCVDSSPERKKLPVLLSWGWHHSCSLMELARPGSSLWLLVCTGLSRRSFWARTLLMFSILWHKFCQGSDRFYELVMNTPLHFGPNPSSLLYLLLQNHLCLFVSLIFSYKSTFFPVSYVYQDQIWSWAFAVKLGGKANVMLIIYDVWESTGEGTGGRGLGVSPFFSLEGLTDTRDALGLRTSNKKCILSIL